MDERKATVWRARQHDPNISLAGHGNAGMQPGMPQEVQLRAHFDHW